MGFFDDPPKPTLDIERATEAFRRVWPDNFKCPVCGHPEFVFAEDLVELSHRSRSLGGYVPTYPCVAVFCTNCGNTLLFNAKVLGLAYG